MEEQQNLGKRRQNPLDVELLYDSSSSDSENNIQEGIDFEIPKNLQNKTNKNQQKQAIQQKQKVVEEEKEMDMQINKEQMNQMNEEDIFDSEFEFYDPDPLYYHATSKFVGNYLDSVPFNFSILADIITSQPGVGTMIGQEDEFIEGAEFRQHKYKDPKQKRLIFGFVTILPINYYKKKFNKPNQQVMMEILQFIEKKSLKHNDDHKQMMETLKNAKNVGLLLNERIINLPFQCGQVLHSEIQKDIEWVLQQKDEDSDLFTFDYLICITKVQKDAKQLNQKKKMKIKDEGWIYQKYEDKLLLEAADIFFTFQSSSSKNISGISNKQKDFFNVIPYRLVYLIKMKNYCKVVKELAKYV